MPFVTHIMAGAVFLLDGPFLASADTQGLLWPVSPRVLDLGGVFVRFAPCCLQPSAQRLARGAQWIFRRINDQSLLFKSLGEGPGNCGFHSFPVETSRWLVPAVVDVPLWGTPAAFTPQRVLVPF